MYAYLVVIGIVSLGSPTSRSTTTLIITLRPPLAKGTEDEMFELAGAPYEAITPTYDSSLSSTPIPPLLLLPGSQYVSTNPIGRDVTAVQKSAAKTDYTGK